MVIYYLNLIVIDMRLSNNHKKQNQWMNSHHIAYTTTNHPPRENKLMDQVDVQSSSTDLVGCKLCPHLSTTLFCISCYQHNGHNSLNQPLVTYESVLSKNKPHSDTSLFNNHSVLSVTKCNKI